MENRSNSTRKRTQLDYILAFKLAVIELVEKSQLTYKKPSVTMAFRGKVLYWFGFVSMIHWIGPRNQSNHRR
ncbi:MAG: hypothetical protein ACNS64_12195 [Candidatus Halalkalibacterium sp. M3_1C_030]